MVVQRAAESLVLGFYLRSAAAQFQKTVIKVVISIRITSIPNNTDNPMNPSVVCSFPDAGSPSAISLPSSLVFARKPCAQARGGMARAIAA